MRDACQALHPGIYRRTLIRMMCNGNLWLVTALTEALNAKRMADGAQPDKLAARQLDVETSTYQRWRSGRAVPGDEHAPALADYLGLPVNDVFALLGEARRARKTATPPRSLEARVDELEAAFAALRDDVMKLLGTPVPDESTSIGQPSGKRGGRSSRPAGRAS